MMQPVAVERGPDACHRRHRGPGPARPISRCAAASMRPIYWARARLSRSAAFGGHATGALKAGDVLHMAAETPDLATPRRAARPNDRR